MIVTGLVWPVLARMVNDAARYYEQNGEILMSRYKCTSGYFFEGLPAPPDADFSLSYSSGSLFEWKQRLFIVSSRSKHCTVLDSIYHRIICRVSVGTTGRSTL